MRDATHETCLMRSLLYHQKDRSSEGYSKNLAPRQFIGTTAIYFNVFPEQSTLHAHVKQSTIFMKGLQLYDSISQWYGID